MLATQKLISEFGKEMKFDVKQKGQKSGRDKSLIKLIKSPAIMASGFSTTFLPSDSDELWERRKLSLQENKAGNTSNIINDEIVARVDKLLEYKRISKKQPNQLLIKCTLLLAKKSKYNYSNSW